MTAVMSGTSGIPLQDNAPVGRGFVLHAVKAMGHTAGLTQRACAMTAHGIVATGRRAGGLLSLSRKRRSHSAGGMEKKRTAGPRPGTGQPQSRTTELYSRIGHRVCRLAQVDPSSLLESLQSKASVSTVPNRGETVKTLTLRLAAAAETIRSESERPDEYGTCGGEEEPLTGTAREPEEVYGPAEGGESKLSPRLSALQSEKAPALSDLADARAQAEEASARVNALESDLASVRRELDEAWKQGHETQAKPRLQLSALLSEKQSLISDLADTRTEAKEARARAGTLASELASVRHDLQEARNQAEKTEARLSSELGALQSEKQSLVSALEPTQAQGEHAISRAGNLDTELADLREELTSAASENEQRQAAIEQESSARRSEGENAGSLSEERSSSPAAGAVQAGEATDVPVEAPEAGSQTAHDDIPAGVTDEDLRVAVFAGAVERFRFTKALSDMDLMMKGVAARARAAKTLGGIPHELSVRALVAQFGQETSVEVRKECICALTALEARAGLPAVEEALKDEAARVRLAAVRATYRLAGLEGAPVLVRMLQDEDEDIRRRAATCLGWLGHEPLASDLLPLLADKSAAVRRAALEALGNLKSSAMVEQIIQLLDDPVRSVQREAFQALRAITGRQMGETFPEDESGRRLLIARWRARREKAP